MGAIALILVFKEFKRLMAMAALDLQDGIEVPFLPINA